MSQRQQYKIRELLQVNAWQRAEISRLQEELDAARDQLREQTKSFCTHCGKLFPKGKEGIEQFQAHIAECNSHPLHPLAQELALAKRLLREVCDEWDRLNRNKPQNRPVTPIVLTREWRAAAKAAGGGQ